MDAESCRRWPKRALLRLGRDGRVGEGLAWELGPPALTGPVPSFSRHSKEAFLALTCYESRIPGLSLNYTSNFNRLEIP